MGNFRSTNTMRDPTTSEKHYITDSKLVNKNDASGAGKIYMAVILAAKFKRKGETKCPK